MYKLKHSTGFTIVELLIVIVVIGILAAITIVAYNGIQKRAVEAVLQNDLHAAATTLQLAGVQNGQSTITSFPSETKTSPKVKLTLSTPTSGSTFCINASYSGSSVTFSYDSSAGMKSGSCSGAVIVGSAIGADINGPLLSDNFNRANSTSSLGTAQTGQAWEAVNGTWGISNNQAYTSTFAENDIAVIQLNTQNAEISARLNGTGDNIFPGILARANESDAYIIELSGSSGRLELARLSGFATLAQTPTGTYTAGALLTLRTKDVSGGVELTVLINSTQVLQYTDTASNRPSGNYFGFRYGTYNSGTVTGLRYDDLTVTAL